MHSPKTLSEIESSGINQFLILFLADIDPFISWMDFRPNICLKSTPFIDLEFLYWLNICMNNIGHIYPNPGCVSLNDNDYAYTNH